MFPDFSDTMDGEVSGLEIPPEVRDTVCDTVEEEHVLIPKITEWCFEESSAPARDEDEVNPWKRRVSTPGKHADLPARLRPIIWRNVGKGVRKSRAWRALLEAQKRSGVASGFLRGPGQKPLGDAPPGTNEVPGREDRLQGSQTSSSEDGTVPTAGDEEEARGVNVLDAVPASRPTDEGVGLEKDGATRKRVNSRTGGSPVNTDVPRSRANACGRQREACGRQATGCGRQLVGSGGELGGSGQDSDGCGRQADGCGQEADGCGGQGREADGLGHQADGAERQTDGCHAQTTATLSRAELTVQKAWIVSVNPSINFNELGVRRASVGWPLTQDEAQLQRGSPVTGAFLRGPESRSGFVGSRKVSRNDELCQIWHSSADSLPRAQALAAGEEAFSCFAALLGKLERGKSLPQTGSNATENRSAKHGRGTWQEAFEPEMTL